MTGITLKIAMQEAERFLKAGKAAFAAQSDPNPDWMCQTKENGSVKRASMDLTRALAEMRKSR